MIVVRLADIIPLKSMPILKTQDLVHSFSNDEVVLNGISLHVEESSIYGFLGPNGAGKTTTLRLVLGLLKVQQGSIEIFGEDFEKNRVKSLREIGSMIESPSIYSHLTAEENLRLLQKVYQCPRTRIGEVLELVGLANTGRKKAGEFSLGMKQRLSIAIALLNSPSLLILDEPTNGLDPAGIHEMRDLIRRFPEEFGVTVFLSSHLLGEVEQIATHIGIINEGHLLFQGTLSELQSKQQMLLTVGVKQIDEATEFLASTGWTVERCDNLLNVSTKAADDAVRVNKLLVERGLEVFHLAVTQRSLEDIFLGLTNGTGRAG